jgi:photosystem II stability/assembly factor-like uncharacterized protein
MHGGASVPRPSDPQPSGQPVTTEKPSGCQARLLDIIAPAPVSQGGQFGGAPALELHVGDPTGTAQGGSTPWQPLGEPGSGGRITSLAVSPCDGDRVLVGGDMLGVGLSTDRGRTWVATTGFSSWEINEFTWDPVQPNVVWVGTLSGPYKSMDGGRTWQPKRSGMPTGDYPYSAPIQKVLIDASEPRHMLAFGGNQRELKEGGVGALHYGLVYESTDAGDSWRTVASLGDDLNILDVASGSQDLRLLYAAVLGRGIYKSTDGGRGWTPVTNGLPHLTVQGVAIDPDHPNDVWAALDHDRNPTSSGVYAPGGIYRTRDGGATWTRASRGLPQISSSAPTRATSMYSVHRAADGTLYTADQAYSNQGRFKSIDGGETWLSVSSAVSRFYPGGASPYVFASSLDGSFVIGGSMDTLIVTENRGAHWTDAGNERTANGEWRGTGFSGLLGTRAVFDVKRRGVLLLTAYDAGNILRSDDNGASWTRPAKSWDNYNGAYDIAIGGLDGSVAYAVMGQQGAFNGILTSTDAGASWTGSASNVLPARSFVGSNRGSVAIASDDGSVAYAVLPNGGLYRTADMGRTWLSCLEGAEAYAVAAEPETGSVYVGTDAGVYAGSGCSLALMAGSPKRIRRLVVDQAGGLYGTGEKSWQAPSPGLWRWADGSWTQLVRDRWVSDVAVDPEDPATIVYSTDDDPYHDKSHATGVWVSRDGGRSSAQFNEGLAMTRVMSVAFDPFTKGRIVIGTDGRGFWQANIG